jgi:acyl-CoA synthetase (AMP-forming)/AMP-acid ligase II
MSSSSNPSLSTMKLPTVRDRYSAEDVARFYAAGWWRSETMNDLLDDHAEKLGDRVFATDRTTTLSFSQLHDRSIRAAVGLRNAGVNPGDRVVVQMPNWTEFIVAVAAVTRAGGVIVPVMPFYRHDEVAYVIEDCDATAVISCESFNRHNYTNMYADVLLSLDRSLPVFVVRSSGTLDVESACEPAFEPAFESAFESLFANGELSALQASLGPSPSADDPHLIVYTSGTTAKPKGCVHTWNTLGYTVRVKSAGLRWSSQDVAFSPSPISHSTGYVNGVMIPLSAGGGTHLMEQWEPVEALRRIQEFGCTTTTTATVFLKMALDVYDRGAHNIDTMRSWVAAGSPIPPSLLEAAAISFPHIELLSGYGRSENMTTTMVNSGEPVSRSLTSDGHAQPGTELRIVDAEGRSLPNGSEGDIAYRGPGHMLGYLGQPELTAELFTADGFSLSGDLGVMDTDGYVRVTGRTKDIIVRGGMNISSREIEELLLGHPGVRDVAVVAFPDERLGEIACACVIPSALSSPPNLESLVAFLRDHHRLAVQKLPERLWIVDVFPMTPSGKVQKHVLRARAAQALVRP